MSEPGRRQLLTALAAWAGGAALAQTPPSPAPEIALRASDGLPVLGSTLQARATWVDFWASWCAPCKLSFPWMNEMHERHGASGLRIVAVNLDRRETDAQRFLQLLPARFALAFDAPAASAKAMDVQAMPTSFLIASDRRILLTHRGFRLEERTRLEQSLRMALS